MVEFEPTPSDGIGKVWLDYCWFVSLPDRDHRDILRSYINSNSIAVVELSWAVMDD
jgi:hypothetical protein